MSITLVPEVFLDVSPLEMKKSRKTSGTRVCVFNQYEAWSALTHIAKKVGCSMQCHVYANTPSVCKEDFFHMIGEKELYLVKLPEPRGLSWLVTVKPDALLMGTCAATLVFD